MKRMKVHTSLLGIFLILVVGAIVGGNLWASSREGEVVVPDFIYQVSKVQRPELTTGSADEAIVLARRNDVTLFRKPTSAHSADLWLFDRAKNRQQRIFKNVIQADLAPSANEAVITTNSFELVRIRLNGQVIDRFEGHGASPVYSPDGKYLAFIKLNDGDLDALAGDPSFVTGVAVHDFAKEASSLIVEANGMDLFGVASWAPDQSRLYYLSSDNTLVTDAGATWSVQVDGTNARQETNIEPGVMPVPYFTKRHLWLDTHRAVSESDGKIWLFKFDKHGAITASSKVADGDQLQWIDDQGTFAYRVSTKSGQSTWVTATGKEF